MTWASQKYWKCLNIHLQKKLSKHMKNSHIKDEVKVRDAWIHYFIHIFHIYQNIDISTILIKKVRVNCINYCCISIRLKFTSI